MQQDVSLADRYDLSKKTGFVKRHAGLSADDVDAIGARPSGRP